MRRPSKPRNRSIDDQDHELTYWSEKLGVPRDRLRDAVLKAGSMRKAVEQQQHWRRVRLWGSGQARSGQVDRSILRGTADERGNNNSEGGQSRAPQRPDSSGTLLNRLGEEFAKSGKTAIENESISVDEVR